MITRRSILMSSLAAPMGWAARRPNVILILTDDQGYGDFGRRMNPILRTPNLDRLAEESVEFTRFSVSPVCAPTRAALMTGRYPLRTGVHGVTKGRETMRMNEVTLAESLKGAGYRTALVGKWHLGENYPYVPHARGFDEFVGFRGGHWNWYFDTPVERNGKDARLEGYIADALTNEAMRFVDQARRDPFFLYLAYNTPHAPYQVPDQYFDAFGGKGLSVENQSVYGMVANLDDNVGRLLAHLEKRGLANDTIVMFACDNGPQTDRFNAGLRARKGSVYEGGTRSPLFVRYPAKLKGGRRVSRITGHIDVMPTILDLARVRRPAGPPMDGVSLRPLLEGSARNWRERLIFTHADHQPDPLKPFPGCARGQRYKMVNGDELYDLEADPGEKFNVAGREPDELRRLRGEYEKWFASTLDGFTVGAPPVPVGYAQENPAVLQAPQATLSGGVRFFQKFGYAHDFVTGWEEGDGMTWSVNVSRAGFYRAEVQYRGPESGLRTRMDLEGGGGTWSGTVAKATSMEEIQLPHRVHNGNEAPVVHWERLDLGEQRMGRGLGTLRLRVGAGACDVKALRLEYVRV
jgi:arylsulfatase A